jgi:DNA polymerase delta subunit 4
MPPSKRASTGATSKAKKSQQSTLAFHGSTSKISKPSITAPPSNKKDLVNLKKADAIAEALGDAGSVEAPTTAEISLAEQVVDDAKAPVSEEDAKALRMSDAQLKKYWREKEAKRKAPGVHQEGLSLTEKICREFDTNGRFGVSHGPTLVVSSLWSVELGNDEC